MQNVAKVVNADATVMEATHQDPTSISDDELRVLFDAVFDAVTKKPDMVYLDDMEVHTKDQAHDSKHDHVNRKEIVSGDAVFWVAEDDNGAEVIQRHQAQYGVYAGKQDGELHYDSVEVELTPK